MIVCQLCKYKMEIRCVSPLCCKNQHRPLCIPCWPKLVYAGLVLVDQHTSIQNTNAGLAVDQLLVFLAGLSLQMLTVLYREIHTCPQVLTVFLCFSLVCFSYQEVNSLAVRTLTHSIQHTTSPGGSPTPACLVSGLCLIAYWVFKE